MDFAKVCRLVESSLSQNENDQTAPDLAVQKRAIIGYKEDIEAYLTAIGNVLDSKDLRGSFEIPQWYSRQSGRIRQACLIVPQIRVNTYDSEILHFPCSVGVSCVFWGGGLAHGGT